MNFRAGLSATLLVTVMVVAVYGRKSKKAVTKGGDVSTGIYNPLGTLSCYIGKNVEMGSSNIFESISSVGADAKIGSKNIFGRRLKVRHDAEIESNNKFGTGFHMGHHATIGDGNSIGNYVQMFSNSKVLDNTKIEDDSILDEYSIVGSGCQIGSYVYLGKHSLTTEGVEIGDRAVVHAYVELSQGATVEAGEIVVPSPSSFELFQQCARFDKIPRNSTSRDINDVLNELINAQFETLNFNCNRGKKRSELDTMPLIKTLYLIKYYGKESFESKYQEVSEISSAGGLDVQLNEMRIDDSNTSGESSSSPSTIRNRPVAANTVRISPGGGSTTGGNHELYNEIHFVENAQRDILNPEVKLKFVQALAAELDSKRDFRFRNDSFCSMIKQIQSGERKVTCRKRRSNIL